MNTNQPSIAELLTRRLKNPEVDVPSESEVQLYDASCGFRVEASTAWRDANIGQKTIKGQPPEWAEFVALRHSAALPMACGVFPQQLSDWQPLLEAQDLSTLRSAATVDAPLPSLRKWVRQHNSEFARHVALQLGEAIETSATDAVALWLSGEWEEAEKLWKQHPESVERNFNLGMALMFRNATKEAVPYLKKAAADLPDSSGWAHLCQLYIAVASTR